MEDKILITVYMDKNMYGELKSASRLSRISRNEIISNAVSVMLKDFRNDDMVRYLDHDNRVMTSVFLDIIQDTRLRHLSFPHDFSKSTLINNALKSYLVSPEMKSLIASPRPMPSSKVLDLPMRSPNTLTVREYLSEMLLSVWQDISFDHGKHRQELYQALIDGGACSAQQDEHGKIIDVGDAEEVISNAIKAMSQKSNKPDFE